MNQEHDIQPAGEVLEASLARLQAVVRSITPEQREAARLETEQRERARHLEKVADILARARAPRRQLKAANLDRGGDWAQAEASLSAKLGSGFLVALIGLRGNGKTQLAVELMRRLAENCRSSRYCTAMELFMEFKSGYRKEGGPSEKEILAEFQKPTLLVVDEIGQRSENEWENRLLYELINRRYANLTDTLLISNQDAAALEQSLGPSIVSRMRETGGVIECNWESYRK